MTSLIKKESVLTIEGSKKELLKRTICKNASDDELDLFAHVCKKTGLDPFMKQIHFVKRSSKNGDVVTIQTAIDGLRLIAERTEKYSPGKEPTFVYGKEGNLFSATSYVKKMTVDGTWHEVSATAVYDEYVQKFYNKEKGCHQVGDFWQNKPHIMLAKCAEALVLRKAFPAEMSGIYAEEEMMQSSLNNSVEHSSIELDHLSEEQCAQLDAALQSDPEALPKILHKLKIENVHDISPKKFDSVIAWLHLRRGKEENESSRVA